MNFGSSQSTDTGDKPVLFGLRSDVLALDEARRCLEEDHCKNEYRKQIIPQLESAQKSFDLVVRDFSAALNYPPDKHEVFLKFMRKKCKGLSLLLDNTGKVLSNDEKISGETICGTFDQMQVIGAQLSAIFTTKMSEKLPEFEKKIKPELEKLSAEFEAFLDDLLGKMTSRWPFSEDQLKAFEKMPDFDLKQAFVGRRYLEEFVKISLNRGSGPPGKPSVELEAVKKKLQELVEHQIKSAEELASKSRNKIEAHDLKFTELTNKFKMLHSETSKKIKTISDHLKTIKTVTKERDDIQKSKTEVENKYNSQSTKLAELIKSYDQKIKNESSVKANIHNSKLSDEIKTLNDKIKSIQGEKDILNENNAKMVESIKAAAEKRAKDEKAEEEKLANTTKDLNTAKSDLKNTKGELDKTMKDLKDQQTEVATHKLNIEGLNKKIAGLNTDLSTEKENLRKNVVELETKKKEISTLTETLTKEKEEAAKVEYPIKSDEENSAGNQCTK